MANPGPGVEAEESPPDTRLGKKHPAPRAFGKPPWKAGPASSAESSRSLVRPPKPGGIRHKHARQPEKRGGANRPRSYPPRSPSIHCLTVPGTASLTDAKHSPVDSQSRLQLPGGTAAVGAGLSQNAAQRRPHPSSSFLRSSYFSPWRHTGGPEVGCWRDPKPTTCSVRRWEGAGAGSRGRRGRTKRREEGRGGEGK